MVVCCVCGNAPGVAVVGLLVGGVIGFIVPFVTAWIGWQLQSAGSLLTIGVETGDNEKIRMSSERLANYFRVMGIIAIILIAVLGLFLMLGVVGMLVSFAA